MKTLIYGGHVIDPANRVNSKLNLLVEDGRIVWIGTEMPDADRRIDATGKLVVKMSMFALPLLCIVIGYIIYLKKYKISEEYYAGIISDLKARGDLKEE